MMIDDVLYAEYTVVRDLGGMTVAEMRQRMTVHEFAEHLAWRKRRQAEIELARDMAKG